MSYFRECSLEGRQTHEQLKTHVGKRVTAYCSEMLFEASERFRNFSNCKRDIRNGMPMEEMERRMIVRPLINTALGGALDSRGKSRSRAVQRDLYDVRFYASFLWDEAYDYNWVIQTISIILFYYFQFPLVKNADFCPIIFFSDGMFFSWETGFFRKLVCVL